MGSLFIDGKSCNFNLGDSVLDVARRNNIEINTLCYLKECGNFGHCSVCLVENEETGELVKSCSVKAEENLKILTNTEKVTIAVKERVSAILNHHNFKCGSCKRKNNCELLSLVVKTRAKKTVHFEHSEVEIDKRSKSIVYDKTKCINCGRCVSSCIAKSGTNAIRFTDWDLSFDESKCLLCGQCVVACPVDALYEKSHIEIVEEALKDKSKHVIVAIAPSVRTSLGEEFGEEFGTDVTKKIYTALRKIGFEKVFDVNFAADVTIVEEGTEFINRIKNNGPFPMFTSCCPGWIRLVENYNEELMRNVSTTKSPQQIFGALAKTYYPKVSNLNPKDVFMVSVMPCTAKKFEADRAEMHRDENKDIDGVLTVRELAKLIREYKIDFSELEDSEVDETMGEYTGAGTIFGATGGVMEAALRSTKDLVEGVSLNKIEYKALRGLEDIKEATVEIAGKEYNIAVINSGKSFFKFKEAGYLDKKQYHFIEVMACPGGCINGGGQPRLKAKDKDTIAYREKRTEVLYNQDEHKRYRKSHENPALIKAYESYLGEAGGELAEKLLHVHREV